jgi:toxin-antitoxin system PIN domain toxin
MTYLPDINVWIALAVAEHVHHEIAAEWLEQNLDNAQPGEIAFCRVTQMGLLRLLTNPKVMGKDALTAADTWEFLDGFCDRGGFVYAHEPAQLEVAWRATTASRRPVARDFWTDAYLAGFATAAGYTLVTFDSGFSRYPDLELLLLTS